MNKQQSLTLCLLYFVGYLFLFPVFEMSVVNFFGIDKAAGFLNAFEWFFYLVFPFIMLKVTGLWIRREFFVFLQRPFKNLAIILKNYGLMLLTSIVVNMLLMMVFGLENSENQSQLIEMFASQPMKVIYASLIFAPIVEELVFRGALFSPFRKKNRVLAYLISCGFFGLLHVYQSLFSRNFKDLLFLISYALLGSYMCRAYDETESMFSSMVLHFVNNLISVMITFML